MKKLYSVLGVLICFCLCFILSGCGSSLVMPNMEGGVKYNGGDVFTIGEYIYFANGFKSYSELTSGGNNTGNVKIGSLCRVKLNENGELEYDTDGELVNKVEVVASKIVGSERTSMFVVGDYIYFASPNTHKTDKLETKFDLISIQRVKLSGGDVKEVFYTEEFNNGSFTVVNYQNKDYALVYTGSKIIASVLGEKINKEYVLAKDVTSAAMPNYGEEFNGDIYFTQKREDEDKGIKGNVVKKVNIASKQETVVQNIEGKEVSFIARENNTVYYKLTVNSYDEGIYSNDLSSLSFDDGKVQQIVVSDITNFRSLGTGPIGHRGFIYNYQNKLWYQSFGGMVQQKILVDGSATVLFTDGDLIYYNDGSKIYRVGYKEEEPKSEIVCEKENIKVEKADFDGRYLYFYAKQDPIKAPENEDDETEEQKKKRETQDIESYYMYRVDTYLTGTTADKNYEFMGIKYKNTEL